MPHLRKRDARSLLEKLAAFSPLVGIFGHRQAGKTTLLEAVCAEYSTLDRADLLLQAQTQPEQLLKGYSHFPAGIDEAQLAPPLFPALKEWVRTRKKPGQFILSGSVRFSSRTAIRESLTGRIVTFDLLPLTLSELEEAPLPDLALRLIARGDLSRLDSELQATPSPNTLKRRTRLIDQYLIQGGLPGVCFIREPRLRSDRIREQLATILDRDIRLVYPTTLTLREIDAFVRALARREGAPIHHQELRKASGVGPVTQKRLLRALEAVYLIRLLPIEGDRTGMAPIFEDQGEATFLQGGSLPRPLQLTHLVFRNVRAQFTYRSGTDETYFQYRTRSGVLVPVAIRTPEGVLGVIGCEGPEPSRREIAAAQSFIRRYGTGKCLLITVGAHSTRVLEPRIAVLPAELLIF